MSHPGCIAVRVPDLRLTRTSFVLRLSLRGL